MRRYGKGGGRDSQLKRETWGVNVEWRGAVGVGKHFMEIIMDFFYKEKREENN